MFTINALQAQDLLRLHVALHYEGSIEETRQHYQMIVQAYTAPVDGKSWKTQESHTQIGSNRDLQHLLESSSASSFPKKSKETKYIVWVLGATVCAVGWPVATGKFSGCASL
ncbi:hypothetical protein HDK77DRAFT_493888 [Phyllosticta capitalensis]